MQRSTGAGRKPVVFAGQVLRGQGQVVFLPNAAASVVFSVALLAAGWEFAVYGLVGSAVGTGIALLLGASRDCGRGRAVSRARVHLAVRADDAGVPGGGPVLPAAAGGGPGARGAGPGG